MAVLSCWAPTRRRERADKPKASVSFPSLPFEKPASFSAKQKEAISHGKGTPNTDDKEGEERAKRAGRLGRRAAMTMKNEQGRKEGKRTSKGAQATTTPQSSTGAVEEGRHGARREIRRLRASQGGALVESGRCGMTIEESDATRWLFASRNEIFGRGRPLWHGFGPFEPCANASGRQNPRSPESRPAKPAPHRATAPLLDHFQAKAMQKRALREGSSAYAQLPSVSHGVPCAASREALSPPTRKSLSPPPGRS